MPLDETLLFDAILKAKGGGPKLPGLGGGKPPKGKGKGGGPASTKPPIDGDGDGLIFDGTPQQRAAPKGQGPRTPAGKWVDPKNRVASYSATTGAPKALNGVAFKPWADAPTTLDGWAAVPGQKKLPKEPPLPEVPAGFKLGSGVIIREPDGRIWLTKPTNEFGGYKHTFPKGTAEEGLSLQANAIKEAFEETGLQVEITGFAGDVMRTTSVGRYYYARRVGGSPAAHGWESEATVLVPPGRLHEFLNMDVDRTLAHRHAGAPPPPPPPKPAPAPKAEKPGGLFGQGLVAPQYGIGKVPSYSAPKAPQGGGKGGGKGKAQAQQDALDVFSGKWGAWFGMKKAAADAPLPMLFDDVLAGAQRLDFAGVLAEVAKAGKKLRIGGKAGQQPPGAKGPAKDGDGDGKVYDGTPYEADAPKGLPQAPAPAAPKGPAPKMGSVDTSKWPAHNGAAQSAKKHIETYKALHAKGDLAGLEAVKPNLDALVKGNPYTKGKALEWVAAHSDLKAKQTLGIVKDAGTPPIMPKAAPEAPKAAPKDGAEAPATAAGWKQVGPQLGSNPGGQFTDPDGVKHYVKFQQTEVHARNEVLASRLYELSGSPALKTNLIDAKPLGGPGLGTETTWTSKTTFDPNNPQHRAAAHEDFATHAWLANWDAVGPDFKNVAWVDGKLTQVDPGGALLFRAQGEPKGKAFGPSVTEWDTMRSPSTPGGAPKVFGGMDAVALKKSAEKVAAIPDEAIRKVVMAHGPGTQAERYALAETMVARKHDVIAKANALGLGPVGKDGVGDIPKVAPSAPVAPVASTPAKVDLTPKAVAPAAPAAPAAVPGALPKPQALANVAVPGTLKGKAAAQAVSIAAAAKAGDALKVAALNTTGATKKWQQGVLEDMGALPKGAKKLSDAEMSAIWAAPELQEAMKKLPPGTTFYAQSKVIIDANDSGNMTFLAYGLHNQGTKEGKLFASQVYAKMQEKAGGPVAPAAAAAKAPRGPAAAASGPGLTKAEMDAVTAGKGYFSPTSTFGSAVLAGDLAAAKEAGKVFQSASAKGNAEKVIAAMEAKAGGKAPAAAAPAPEASVTVKAPPALPAKLTAADLSTPANPVSGKMAAANDKMHAIAENYASGGVDAGTALLGLDDLAATFPATPNTYWKKVAKNHAAIKAAIASHAGAKGAGGAGAAAAPKLAQAPAAPPPVALKSAATPKPAPKFDPKGLNRPPDFEKWSEKGGQPLSSKPEVNAANNAAVAAIYEQAKKGDLDGLKAMKVPDVNGNPIPVADHPSQHVKAYHGTLVQEIDLQLNPPQMPTLGRVVASGDWDDIASKLKPVPAGKAVAAIPKTQKVGAYIVVGKADPLLSVPKKDDSLIGSDAWKQKAVAAYNAAPQAAKDTFSTYVTTSGAKALNTALREGNLTKSHDGKSVQQHMKDFEALLVDVPEGSTFVRRMGSKGYGMTPVASDIAKLQQFLLTAEKGTVVQEPGFSSTSWTGGNTILGNNDVEWKFTAGKGVRVFPGWLTANQGEGEGLFPPNQRYLITGAKKVGKTVVVEAVLLPTIPNV